MPHQDPEKRRERGRAYSRAHYLKNREKVLAKTTARKHKEYAGVCRNCGGPTVGMSPKHIPEWCAKPECAQAQRRTWYPDRAYGPFRFKGWKQPEQEVDSSGG